MRKIGWIFGLVASFLLGPFVYVGARLCEGFGRGRETGLLPGARARST